ncbi:MAG: hypothetical protein ACXACG_12500 [Candidatus Thorarchaeota archaeon]
MYIPSRRSLRLVEIQESVLPEDEWLIGISDLGYFKGVGYSMPLVNDDENVNESGSLYAFLPGLFYCSSQQTSVDAVLIEVTHKSLSGVVLPSFRPEDVRTFDVGGGITLDETGQIEPVEMTIDTLGSFGVESFLKNSGIGHETFSYKREIQIASHLAEKIPLSDLKRAYVSSSFLQDRLTKLLDDIEFYELKPRMRVYVRNRIHPYGTVVDVKYRGLDDDIDFDTGISIKIPDDAKLEKELGNLSFSKMVDSGVETDVERAILDMLLFIRFELEGSVTHQEVLKKLFEEGI